MKMKKKLNIAIIGLGNIGSNLYQYLIKNKILLSEKTNIIPNIIYKNKKKKIQNTKFKMD